MNLKFPRRAGAGLCGRGHRSCADTERCLPAHARLEIVVDLGRTGLAGALVGFWIFHGLFGIGDTKKFDWGGIVGAVIGAMIVVAVASFLIKRFAKRPAV